MATTNGIGHGCSADEVGLCDTGKLGFCTGYLTDVPSTYSVRLHGVFAGTSKVKF